MTRAESVKIDTDEGRFLLIVTTEDGDRHTFDIHHLALEVEAEVRRELRPYALEAEHARQAVAAGIPRHVYLGLAAPADKQADGSGRLTDGGYENPRHYDEAGSAYALDDPKHPTFHERMVD